jgi:putative ABC transport system permease protein
MNISRAIYRALLRLCPRDLTAEFGAEMEALFLAELSRSRGVGKAGVWRRAVSDVLRHGFGARNDRWKRYRKTSAYVEYDTRGWSMETWRYDLRHAVRAMFRQKTTTAIILVTLALAIGANTAVFSAVHAALLRPLPYADPDALVMLYEKRTAEGTLTNPASPADYLDWARLNRSFASIAALGEDAADLTGSGDPERLLVHGVTSAFFDVFGVRPILGRTFQASEDTPGNQRVVILAHSLWQQRFGADPSVIGRRILLNDIPHEVVGVLPSDAEFPQAGAAIFAPLLMQPGAEPPLRAAHYLRVYGRLKPGVAIEQARAELDQIGRNLESQYPDVNRGHGAHVTSLAPEMVKSVRGMLLILMAAVAFILLIACINVTNLLLARAAGRRREMALRAAIGAGRGRLMRQVIAEATVLALIGGAIGLLIAWWAAQLLAAQMPAAVRPGGAIVFSLPVLLFTVTACFVAGLLAGVMPAWQVVDAAPAETLKEGGRSPVSLRRKLRFGLVVAEVAFTSLLLVGAGLTLRSFERVLTEPAGVETSGRLTFNVRLPRARYTTPDAYHRLFTSLEHRLAAEAPVKRVGATSALPLTIADGRNGMVIDGYERDPAVDPPTRAHPRGVTAGYMSAAGMQITSGRGFADADRGAAAKVAIINETMAGRYWRGRPALGGRVRFVQEQEWREVVGIVRDVKHWGLDAPVNPELYMPLEQYPTQSMSFVVETAANPLTLIPNVRRHLAELDPGLPLSSVRTFDEVASRSVEQRRFTMTLLACFALLAMVLAAAGIYGVMAHLVSLRTPEIGVRLTLGANPFGVMRQVLGEGAAQAAIGLLIGLGASLALMKGLGSILFGIEPTDPLTLLSVGGGLMVVALLAVAVPALRAMRVDPVTALRN